MNVRHIKINKQTMTGETFNINISLSEQFTPVDQADIIERKFVEKGVKDSINPIIDNEIVRYTPNTISGVVIPNVEYNLSLLSGGVYQTTYGGADFVNDDLLYRRNNLKESFLRLSFYDNNRANKAYKLIELTIYPEFVNPYEILEDKPLTFKVSDMVLNPAGFSEGYLLYYKKSDGALLTGKTIYMKAEFNNAKTGKVHKLMTQPGGVDATAVVENLFTDYELKRYLGDRYIYHIDDSQSNVTHTTDTIKIDLYEVKLT